MGTEIKTDLTAGFTGVQVDGLRQLRNAMRKAEAGSQKFLQVHLKQVAINVANHARDKVPSLTGAARDSVRAYATTESAYIRGGGEKVPYFPWLDFGGTTGRGHYPGRAWSGSSRRDWYGRPFGSGRYIYPTIYDESDEILQAVMEAIDEAEVEAGWERV